MKNKYKYIDLFSGCGGLSLGLFNSQAWEGLFAVEKSADAFETLEHNLIEQNSHFNWPDWLPKKSHEINSLIKEYKNELAQLRGAVDLVAGGPPCQGFSTAGKRNEGDIRNKLIDSYLKFIRIVQPKMIFFENVKGFTQQFDKNKVKGRVYSKYVRDALSRKIKEFSGYHVYGELVNFADFGIPQKRTRFILVGIRKDLNTAYTPKQFFDLLYSCKESFLSSKGLSSLTTLEDAVSDLVQEDKAIPSPDSPMFLAGSYGNIQSSYQKYIRLGKESNSSPDSHRFARHNHETQKKFEYILKNAEKNKTLSPELKDKFSLSKRTLIPLAANTPTATLTTLPDDYLHYKEPRIFTVREYARIQSFNDWYEFKGKYTTGGDRRKFEVPRYSQIGNAIPPLFSEQASLVLKEMLENGR
jgi:DNA (cytosine-5)-methyltransferase 1